LRLVIAILELLFLFGKVLLVASVDDDCDFVAERISETG
jgi:hypothetical protein